VDTRNAADMVDAIIEDGGFDGDVPDARHWVEVRARSLWRRWRSSSTASTSLGPSMACSGIASPCGVSRTADGHRRPPAASRRAPPGASGPPRSRLAVRRGRGSAVAPVLRSRSRRTTHWRCLGRRTR
jgi:hypothetical protein